MSYLAASSGIAVVAYVALSLPWVPATHKFLAGSLGSPIFIVSWFSSVVAAASLLRRYLMLPGKLTLVSGGIALGMLSAMGFGFLSIVITSLVCEGPAEVVSALFGGLYGAGIGIAFWAQSALVAVPLGIVSALVLRKVASLRAS